MTFKQIKARYDRLNQLSSELHDIAVRDSAFPEDVVDAALDAADALRNMAVEAEERVVWEPEYLSSKIDEAMGDPEAMQDTLQVMQEFLGIVQKERSLV